MQKNRASLIFCLGLIGLIVAIFVGYTHFQQRASEQHDVLPLEKPEYQEEASSDKKYTPKGKDTTTEQNISNGQTSDAVYKYGDYHIRILVLEERDVLHTHFEQSLVYNVTVDSVLPEDLSYYDLIVVRGDVIDERIIRYVEEGGVLSVFGGIVPDLIPSIEEGSFKTEQPAFPAVAEDLQEIQQVLSDWATIYPIEYTSKLGIDIIGDPIMKNSESEIIALHRFVGQGNLLWFADFADFGRYSVSLTFDDQKPFHPGLAALTGFLADEIVHLVSLRKYGFSLERPLGTYGTPMMAWQNHYEAAHAFARKDYSRWYNLLQDYNQIPTFTVIRGSFDWGRWRAGIVVNPNTGDVHDRVYDGYLNNSFYTTGIILSDDKGYLEFGTYPAFRTLFAELKQPFRTVPQFFNNRLLIGTPDGHVYVTDHAGEWRFTNTRRLADVKVDALAAPYYKDGYLLVGGNDDNIKIYKDRGDFNFRFVGYVRYKGNTLSLRGPLVPVLDDDNLYVGDEAGNVYLLKDKDDNFNFNEKVKVLTTEDLVVAPFPFDWNNDGEKDLLIGGKSGKVGIYLKVDDEYEFYGNVKGRNYNFFFTRDIKVGHFSVPRMSPNGDLLIGGSMYGIPYAINDPLFPYREYVKTMAQWAKERQLILGAHLDLNPSMPPELEQKAYILHKQAFEELGIPWEDMGVNHHSWFITEPIRESFKMQVQNDIKFNFGFRPPGMPGAPKDGRHFVLSKPFIYEPIDNKEILLYQPAANISTFKNAWNIMVSRGMPMTYFQHVEYLNQQIDDLSQLIDDLEDYRKRYGYVFSTEHQMAKSIKAALQTNLYVEILEDGFNITPLREGISDWIGDYAYTAGVVVRTDKDTRAYTDSMIQRYRGSRLSLGLPGKQRVSFEQNIKPSWWIEATNSPVMIKEEYDDKTLLHITAKGFQEIHFAGQPGEISYMEENARTEKIVHDKKIVNYGAAITVIVND